MIWDCRFQSPKNSSFRVAQSLVLMMGFLQVIPQILGESYLNLHGSCQNCRCLAKPGGRCLAKCQPVAQQWGIDGKMVEYWGGFHKWWDPKHHGLLHGKSHRLKWMMTGCSPRKPKHDSEPARVLELRHRLNVHCTCRNGDFPCELNMGSFTSKDGEDHAESGCASHIILIYLIWLVVWNINFIFPYIGNNHPNWRSYFSEGLKPPTSNCCPPHIPRK